MCAPYEKQISTQVALSWENGIPRTLLVSCWRRKRQKERRGKVWISGGLESITDSLIGRVMLNNKTPSMTSAYFLFQ